MTAKRWFGALGGTAVVAAALAIGSSATASHSIGWKGGESFSPIGLGPNVQRCGNFPRNVEARFAGSGIDTEGGAFNVMASGCLDTKRFRVSDLKATDTFLSTGDKVYIETDDYTMAYDESTCVLTNRNPVKFRVAGGTGKLEGATGSGHFHTAMNWHECNGRVLPVQVWFEGHLLLAD